MWRKTSYLPLGHYIWTIKKKRKCSISTYTATRLIRNSSKLEIRIRTILHFVRTRTIATEADFFLSVNVNLEVSLDNAQVCITQCLSYTVFMSSRRGYKWWSNCLWFVMELLFKPKMYCRFCCCEKRYFYLFSWI